MKKKKKIFHYFVRVKRERKKIWLYEKFSIQTHHNFLLIKGTKLFPPFLPFTFNYTNIIVIQFLPFHFWVLFFSILPVHIKQNLERDIEKIQTIRQFPLKNFNLALALIFCKQLYLWNDHHIKNAWFHYLRITAYATLISKACCYVSSNSYFYGYIFQKITKIAFQTAIPNTHKLIRVPKRTTHPTQRITSNSHTYI